MGRFLRRALGGCAVAAVIAIAVPFLVPLSHFIPELTRFASKELGQPVTMEDLRLHLLPRPRVVGHRISVGRRAQVLISELEIEPDLFALASGRRTLRLIRANRVVLDESVLALPGAMPKRAPAEALNVRRLVLTAVKLEHPKLELPLFDVDVRLGAGLRLLEARLETHDAKLRLKVRPSGADALALHLNATHWKLPLGAPLAFDALEARGTLRKQQLHLESVEGALYGGKVAGAGQVEWGRQWEVAGKAQLAGVELVPLQVALGKPAKLSGRLNADAGFSTRAKVPAELRDALRLAGPFEVMGGVYQGVDLARAGELADGPRSGEATTFEELRGRVELSGQHVRLQPLCMRSPKLVAGGRVEIAPDKSLSGRLDISVAQTGGILGVPVTLSGTTDEVNMRPTKGYLIGAAIGTVLMPGIGTSIGSTLGGRIEGTSGCK